MLIGVPPGSSSRCATNATPNLALDQLVRQVLPPVRPESSATSSLRGRSLVKLIGVPPESSARRATNATPNQAIDQLVSEVLPTVRPASSATSSWPGAATSRPAPYDQSRSVARSARPASATPK